MSYEIIVPFQTALPEMRNKSLELYAPGSRSSNGMSMSTVSSLQSEKSGNFATSDDNRNHIVSFNLSTVHIIHVYIYRLKISKIVRTVCFYPLNEVSRFSFLILWGSISINLTKN